MPLTSVVGRLGARVLARRRPPVRAGGLHLARLVAARHLPGGLAAAARLSRERVAVAAAAARNRLGRSFPCHRA